MFENLKLSEFTWPREPILYLTLIVAILNVAIQFLTGDLSIWDGLESIGVLIAGFIGRGQVTPS